MARTLKQELVRSTFQEKQLKVIEQINKNTGEISRNTDDIREFLRHNLLAALDEMAENLSRALIVGFNTNANTYHRTFNAYADQTKKTTTELAKKQTEIVEKVADQTQDLIEEMKIDRKAIKKEIVGGLSDFLKELGVSFGAFRELSESFLESTNSIVMNTGSTRLAAADLRGYINEEVRSLNAQYDNLYNAADSYSTIATIINQTGIKDLGFYKDYAKMFLKTQMSMNVNLGTLATFSDKFYRKYSFSAAAMEQMTEGIRKNTAGTSVGEDEMLNFLTDLDPFLQMQANAESLTTGKSYEQTYRKLNEEASSTYAWMSEQGIDPAPFYDLAIKAFSDATSKEADALRYLFRDSTENLLAAFMKDNSGFMGRFIDVVANQGDAFGRQFIKSGIGEIAASSLNLDLGMLTSTSVVRQQKGIQSYEDWLKTRETDESLSKNPPAEQYVSTEERFANSLSYYGENLATLQEQSGMSLSFVEKIYKLLSGVLGTGIGDMGSTTLGTFLGNKLANKLLGGVEGGFGGLIAKFGPALGVAGFVAGGVFSFLQGWAQSQGYNQEFQEQTSEQMLESLKRLAMDDPEALAKNPLYWSGNNELRIDENGNVIPAGEYGFLKEQGALSSEEYYNKHMRDSYGKAGMGSPLQYGGSVGDSLKYSLARALLGPLFGAGWFSGESFTQDPLSYAPILGDLKGIGEVFNTERMSGQFQQEQTSPLESFLRTSGGTLDRLVFNEYVDKFKTLGETEKFFDNLDTYVSLYKKGYLAESIREDGYPGDPMSVENGKYKYSPDLPRWVPQYEAGTPFVPENQYAYLHKGEAVLTKEENEARKFKPTITSEMIQALKAKPESSHVEESTLESMQSLVEVVKGLKDFLEFWRSDSIDRESLAAIRSSSLSNAQKLALLNGETSLASDYA